MQAVLHCGPRISPPSYFSREIVISRIYLYLTTVLQAAFLFSKLLLISLSGIKTVAFGYGMCR
jgi:hypothetical protein